MTTSFSVLKVGAGGYITGNSFSSDGVTKFIRTDTFGCYRLIGSTWHQMIATDSFPSAYGDGGGVYEICVAPGDATIGYMLFRGNMFKTIDGGANWTYLSGFSTVTVDANDTYRYLGRKIAVDPNDATKVYVGTASNGVFVTTNGGTSWAAVSGIPASNIEGSDYPGHTIAFDGSATIYASSWGNGVYVSTNSGSTWTLTTSGPTKVRHMAVASDHRVWVCDGTIGSTNSNNTWRYTSGTWAQLTVTAISNTDASSNGINVSAIAINPLNADHVIVQHTQGAIGWSRDASNATPTWQTNYPPSLSKTATDVPWLAVDVPTDNLDVGDLTFDPQVSGKLWLGTGTGVWTGTAPPALGTTMAWTSASAGIEQLNSEYVIHPPGGYPLYSCLDRGVFTLTDLTVYPSHHQESLFAPCYSIDYASSNPDFIGAIIQSGSPDFSSFSNNKGVTWTRFSSVGTMPAQFGGTLAISTPSNMVWIPITGGVPYYTKDGGATWAAAGITTTPISDTGWGFSLFHKRRCVAADRVNANTFYAYNYITSAEGGGVWRSTNSGDTWTRVFAGPLLASSGINAKIKSVPGNAQHLFFTSGADGQDPTFIRSTNGGTNWSTVSTIDNLIDFGFGAIAPGQSYPSIYAIRDVVGGYTIYRSDDNCVTWTNLGQHPINSFDVIHSIDGDKGVYGKFYIGFGGSGGAFGADVAVSRYHKMKLHLH